MGNIHSILKALRLYHDDVEFTADPAVLRGAQALVLPGDGAFAAAMDNLAGEKADVLREHVAAQKPLLGVCIGFQILFEDSDEGPGGRPGIRMVPGLGLIPGNIRRFHFEEEHNKHLRIPHMGWNPLRDAQGVAGSFDEEHMYFIHSYRATNVPDEFVLAKCDYGGDVFPAMVASGSVLATQFHPEKSHTQGLRLLEEWVARLKS